MGELPTPVASAGPETAGGFFWALVFYGERGGAGGSS